MSSGVDDEGESGDGGDDAGEGYGLDTSSDDRRGIPVKGGRGAGRRREVEREDIEEREGDGNNSRSEGKEQPRQTK